MSAPSSQTWIHAATRHRAGYAGLRISDAERAEVADLLSRHYGDGRLDQAEFNERLDQAMRAKTYADLSGLFADLPRTGAAEAAKPSSAPRGCSGAPGGSRASGAAGLGPRRHPLFGVLGLVLLIAAAAAVGHGLPWSLRPWAWSPAPWVSVGLLGLIVLYAIRKPRGPS